ncbi:hypothetical protein [Psychroserpens sp. SPM9]|uniref:hypothetical protein n=1 Tax=Psychroserpens sp. SPM9 TaxID=2975598 RepID=UPI0021A5AB76|nr:hypothetical protein [Psychroserpens sp. SPM9]MDG5490595.1 hypothetical protein [Psychroserpens sp. SPM9]
MRVTLKINRIEDEFHALRHNIDLYNSTSVEKLVRKLAEFLEVGTSVIRRALVPLLKYIEQDRQILQDAIQSHTDALFPLNSDRFDIILRHLFKRLKRINYKVKDVKQIRASVIVYLLNSNNIREVQYMAGHRFISSTERYLQDDLENLHEMIENLHPIN